MDEEIAPPDRRFTIRQEQPGDLPAARAVNDVAFAGPAEGELVARLHQDGDVLFGLVAEASERPIGHILFSPLPIELDTGGIVLAAALGPLAVVPAWQGQRVGSALVREGLARCRGLGVPAVVVLGDPGYYSRFGFRVEAARGLRSPWSGPYLMAIEIVGGVLGDGAGQASYAAAFG